MDPYRSVADVAQQDQLQALFDKRLDEWVSLMQEETARGGADQAISNVGVRLLMKSDPSMNVILLVLAIERLAKGKPGGNV